MAIYTVKVSLWALHAKKISGDITILCVNFLDTLNVLPYFSFSVKCDLDASLVSIQRFITFPCTLKSARRNSGLCSRILTSGQ